MTRLCPPDAACGQLEIISENRAARYTPGARGYVNVDDAKHEKALREIGCFPAAGRPAHASGFICGDCGFRGWFKGCGRCGSENSTREETRHA